MSKNRLLRRAQVYNAPALGGVAGMRGPGGGLSTTLVGNVRVVAVKGGSVRAPRGGMTVLAATLAPTPAQNSHSLLNGKDTARRDKALGEVLLRDPGGRRSRVTGATGFPGEGGGDELEALDHRGSTILQVVVDEVEVVATATLGRQGGNSVLLTILERAEAEREVAALLRGTAGATAERGTTLGSVMRRGGGVTSTLRREGRSGLKTGPHPLMVPSGLGKKRGAVVRSVSRTESRRAAISRQGWKGRSRFGLCVSYRPRTCSHRHPWRVMLVVFLKQPAEEGGKSPRIRKRVRMKTVFRSSSAVAELAALLLLAVVQLVVNVHVGAPPPGAVKIDGFDYNGDGCPVGSVQGSISCDSKALTVMFNTFTATTDEGQQNMRKSCVVTVMLNYPPGFFFTLGTVTMRGYAKLDAGVKGTMRTGYHISGRIGSGQATHVFNGQFDGNYEVTDYFQNAVGSECGKIRDLNINSEVRVHPGKPPRIGVITMDSQDLKLTQIFAINWSTVLLRWAEKGKKATLGWVAHTTTSSKYEGQKANERYAFVENHHQDPPPSPAPPDVEMTDAQAQQQNRPSELGLQEVADWLMDSLNDVFWDGVYRALIPMLESSDSLQKALLQGLQEGADWQIICQKLLYIVLNRFQPPSAEQEIGAEQEEKEELQSSSTTVRNQAINSCGTQEGGTRKQEQENGLGKASYDDPEVLREEGTEVEGEHPQVLQKAGKKNGKTVSRGMSRGGGRLWEVDDDDQEEDEEGREKDEDVEEEHEVEDDDDMKVARRSVAVIAGVVAVKHNGSAYTVSTAHEALYCVRPSPGTQCSSRARVLMREGKQRGLVVRGDGV
ncbi:hypothetical protein CBR_g68674 [Chara braunii]|uniref:Uncharacterized protein n=1 Tax=Chara braunii TaxID=69332 RepID=A0A388K9G9_CHABU|nr:hypothetical protein CBR_g68674 [Chara braunii]|eukprot:GBG66690.1 hypothetical protein CBR_g68674 [Chara braunii]